MSRLLHVAARIAVAVGAAGSVAAMYWVGRHNSSLLVMGFFLVWVLVPFGALAFAHAVSPQWSETTRGALYGVTLTLAVMSLAIYGRIALGPPQAKPAFWFLVFPVVSLVSIAVALGVAAFAGRRQP